MADAPALAIPLDEIWEFVRGVESGAIHLTAREEAQSVYAGVVEYSADNGWRVAVFNDANEFDYFEWFESSDGRRVEFDDFDGIPELRDYTPSAEVAWERYRIPGYAEFRCVTCGVKVRSGRVRCDEHAATTA